MTMTIDSHHHFWIYSAREYGWIDDDMSVIQRSFLPADLEAEIGKAGVDGVVSVQARQCLEETDWLLDLAGQHDVIRGVVGWFPLQSPAGKREIDRRATNPFLKGVRHVVQDEEDDEFILGEAFNKGVEWVGEAGLTYDILIFERHLPGAIRFADRHQTMHLVLDHIAKPRIRDNQWQPWVTRIQDLARRPNVWCKLSGLVTEADPRSWQVEQLEPYMDVVLEAFGPDRVMFGSDWPVCLVGCSYQRWVDVVRQAIATLSESEQAQVLGGSACRAYRL